MTTEQSDDGHEFEELPIVPIDELLNHKFEYFVWHRGAHWPVGKQRHQDIDGIVISMSFAFLVDSSGQASPVYVFRDDELWLTIRAEPKPEARIQRLRIRNHWLRTTEFFQSETNR